MKIYIVLTQDGIGSIWMKKAFVSLEEARDFISKQKYPDQQEIYDCDFDFGNEAE